MENKQILESLEKIISKERIKQNEPMKNHTSFKIGGPAEFYIKITSIKELQKILEFVKKEKIKINIQWYWNFENNKANSDIQDTEDSKKIKRYQFNLYALGEEI